MPTITPTTVFTDRSFTVVSRSRAHTSAAPAPCPAIDGHGLLVRSERRPPSLSSMTSSTTSAYTQERRCAPPGTRAPPPRWPRSARRCIASPLAPASRARRMAGNVSSSGAANSSDTPAARVELAGRHRDPLGVVERVGDGYPHVRHAHVGQQRAIHHAHEGVHDRLRDASPPRCARRAGRTDDAPR